MNPFRDNVAVFLPQKTSRNRMNGFIMFLEGGNLEHGVKMGQWDGLVHSNTNKELFFKCIKTTFCPTYPQINFCSPHPQLLPTPPIYGLFRETPSISIYFDPPIYDFNLNHQIPCLIDTPKYWELKTSNLMINKCLLLRRKYRATKKNSKIFLNLISRLL